MKISYDPEIDALYIRLIEGKHECRTVRPNEEIALCRKIIVNDRVCFFIEIANTRDTQNMIRKGHDTC